MEGLGVSAHKFSALAGKRIFLTGHTGFKGGWLVPLLNALGSKVFGYGLPPTGTPDLYDMAAISKLLAGETLADIRDRAALAAAVQEAEPDIVIHMAAQALVRHSYSEPAETWDVNVMGTVNVLDVVRTMPSIQGALIITTDKCYENRGWEWGYRESDRLGGHDPYSASKAGAELVVASYRRSFFADGTTRLVSARAGNVIGGGDWNKDRLIPDAARAAAAGMTLIARNPKATRPWQHVLDCLGGYLSVTTAMLDTNAEIADAYNFGPNIADNLAVGTVLARLQEHWPELQISIQGSAEATAPQEAAYLYLDSSRAMHQLGWRPHWGLDTALARTASWYRIVQSSPDQARPLMLSQIDEFLS